MRPKDMEKREAIKQATFALVAEQGVVAVKMAALAKAVGISASTLYVYFKDKEDLILTLFSEVTKSMVLEVVAEFQPSRPYKVNLKHVWAKYLNYRVRNHQEIVFYERVKTSPFYQKMAWSIKSAEMEVPMQLIRLGQEQMLLKNVDEKLLMATLSGMTESFSDLFIQGELELNDTNIDHCFTLMWDSLKA